MVDSNKKLIQRGVSSIEETETAINEKAREEYVEAQDTATLEAAKGYTDTTVAALVDGAPETLDTLKEIADALKANEDGAAAILEVIGTKADSATTVAALARKVDKAEGKGLSANDYTDTEKEKLAGIEAGANAYIHPETHPADMIIDTDDKVVMTSAEREKLAGLDSYTLPAATADALGGVKAGSNVTIAEDGALSATAMPYELPTASATTLGGVKIGDNLTVDADGRLSAPAGGGSGGDGATIFMPWVEPIFDTNPNVPTNQQAFIAAWGPAIATYSAANERSRLVINTPFLDETSFKMDCQALPDTDIEAGIVGYTLAATAIVPMAMDGVNISGLRNYMSAHITIASGVITSVDSFLMSFMIDMESGLPNYLLDSGAGGGGGGGGGSVVIDITNVSTSETGVFDETQLKAAIQPHVATFTTNPETRVMIRSGAMLLPATAGATDVDIWISSLETNPLYGGDVQNVHVLVASIYCRIQNGVIQTAVGGINAHDLATESGGGAKIAVLGQETDNFFLGIKMGLTGGEAVSEGYAAGLFTDTPPPEILVGAGWTEIEAHIARIAGEIQGADAVLCRSTELLIAKPGGISFKPITRQPLNIGVHAEWMAVATPDHTRKMKGIVLWSDSFSMELHYAQGGWWRYKIVGGLWHPYGL